MDNKNFPLIALMAVVVVIVAAIGVYAVTRTPPAQSNQTPQNPNPIPPANNPEQPTDRVYTYVSRDGKTYGVADSETLNLAFDGEVLALTESKINYVTLNPLKPKNPFTYSEYDIVSRQNQFTGKPSPKGSVFSPTGEYYASYYSKGDPYEQILTLVDTKKNKVVRTLKPSGGWLLWLNDTQFLFSAQVGGNVPKYGGGEQYTPFLYAGISMYDVKARKVTSVWKASKTNVSFGKVYKIQDEIFFTRIASEYGGYQEPYFEKITNAYFKYNLTTKKLTQTDTPTEAIDQLLQSKGLPTDYYSVSQHPFDENLLVIKLVEDSEESDFYLIDYKSMEPKLELIANGGKLILSKLDLLKALNLTNPDVAMVAKTSDGKRKVYSNYLDRYQYEVPVSWINTEEWGWLDGEQELTFSVVTYNSNLSPADWLASRAEQGQQSNVKVGGKTGVKLIEDHLPTYKDIRYVVKRDKSTIVVINFRSYETHSYSKPPVVYDRTEYEADYAKVIASFKFN